jgi:hypothetical protein
MRLPDPRGPLSESLFDCLVGSRARPLLPEGGDDPLADDDLQLALYCAHELHYGGLDGVDDSREWEPGLLEFELAAEAMLIAAVRDELRDPDPALEPDEVAAAIFAAVEADDEDAPPLSRYLEGRATIEQFREFVIHRSAYQLKEADPHTFAMPRIQGPAKAAMVEIQADEYGGGRFERMHSQLFATTMSELGLDPTPGAYVGRIGASTLAGVNLISAFSLRRRWRGALVGHLAGFEITSPGPNRRYAAGLRRLGIDQPATEFYDEHVEADSVHENIAAYDLAGGLAHQEPELSGQILFGVRALLVCERRFASHLLGAFEGGRSSLLAAQPEPLAA